MLFPLLRITGRFLEVTTASSPNAAGSVSLRALEIRITAPNGAWLINFLVLSAVILRASSDKDLNILSDVANELEN